MCIRDRDSKTEIRDYGAYSSVRNLTSEADISLDGDLSLIHI